METGTILRGVGGFYTVALDSAAPEDGQSELCKPRGRFRREGITPLAGDRAEVQRQPSGLSRIERILPRANVFLRPPVANLDVMVIVASLALPRSDPFLLDRVTAVCESKGIQAVIALNKNDLEPVAGLADIYRAVGYPVVITSAETGEGIETLRALLRGKRSAFTGNSGVGKSSLLRRLEPSLELEVGEVSEKLGRGRHTTRAVSLWPLRGGGYVADTPGFSSFDPERMELGGPAEIERAFPEFAAYREHCRFRDCLHVRAQDCAVHAAVQRGDIPRSRYESYVRLVTDNK